MTLYRTDSFQQISKGLPVQDLIRAIQTRDSFWARRTERQDTPGSPHHDTETIFLRWANTQTILAAFTEIEAVDYPEYDFLPEARPLVNRCLDLVSASQLGRVILTKLHPGGFIDQHIDEGAYADHYERFHVPLTSEAGNHFTVLAPSGVIEDVHMKPGELWCFNHKRMHSVVNRSDEERIHLIIDAVAPAYRKERERYDIPA